MDRIALTNRYALASAFCFVLGGTGATVISGLLISPLHKVITAVCQSAIVFVVAWYIRVVLQCSWRLRPLLEGIGIAGLCLFLGTLLFQSSEGSPPIAAAWPNFDQPLLLTIAAAVVGCLWSVGAESTRTGQSERATERHFLTESLGWIGFIVAGFSIGAIVGFSQGFAISRNDSALHTEAAFVGGLAGLFFVPVCYALLGGRQSSSVVAGSVAILTIIVGIALASMLGLISALLTPVAALLLGRRIMKSEEFEEFREGHE